MARDSGEGNRFLVIDLKSFYASVECVDRGLDPMTTNLVVADPERSRGTICLAITPAMKALGVHNRCRLYEIPGNIKYIIAPPRMKRYVDVSARIYGIYLDYVSKEDIHVYSIDEAFIDVTPYHNLYNMSAMDLGKAIMNSVFEKTGIRATCGVGTNLYLAKIALDIMAKKAPDFIYFLDEKSYVETLWNHRPLTDFWRIGRGTSRRLQKYGIYTMRGIAEADEDLIYKLFGIDGELLIDHAWGRESATMKDIKAYKPEFKSLCSGQVLMRDYRWEEARVIVCEMVENLCLELLNKNLVTSAISVAIGYSKSVSEDWSRGSGNLPFPTNVDSIVKKEAVEIYEKIVKRNCPIRRVSIFFSWVEAQETTQCSMFEHDAETEEERSVQKTVAMIKNKYGKNSILRGQDYEDCATARERNMQIGGHKSGE